MFRALFQGRWTRAHTLANKWTNEEIRHVHVIDRMLIAQAMLDDLVLISIERAFDAYGVRRLW